MLFVVVAGGRNHWKRALMLASATSMLSETLDVPVTPSEQAIHVQERAQQMVASDVLAKIWVEGQAMTLEQAIANALEPDR